MGGVDPMSNTSIASVIAACTIVLVIIKPPKLCDLNCQRNRC